MKISDGLWSIGDTSGGHVRALLLDDGAQITLIDTCFQVDAGLILQEMDSINQPYDNITNIIITHAHRSHIGGLQFLRELTGATVWASESEREIIEGNRKATKVGYKLKGKFHPTTYSLQLLLAMGLGKHKPCTVDGILKDGDTIGSLTVIETPGHTPGSISLWWPDRKVLFCGDSVNLWPWIGPWDGFTLDEAASRRSISKLADISNAQYLCSGHGDPLPGASGILKELSR